MIHCIIVLMYAKAPYTIMHRATHIHPTVSDLFPTMVAELKPLARALELAMIKSASSVHRHNVICFM